MKIKIKLGTVNNAALFTAKCNEYIEDIDFIYGKYMVDAKSLMGILSVGLANTGEVHIHSENQDVLDKFQKDIELWIVN